jgi:AcrR family transcriptional regulator
MAQQPERAEQSRARIIEAARQVLVEGGGDFELTDLARRAGVSVGLPYHRFGSKSGVMAAVVTEFYDGIRRAIDLGDFAELDWDVRERERLRRLVEYLYGDPLAAVIISSLGRDPEVAALEATLWSETIEAAARNLAKAQQRRQVATGLEPSLAAAMICGGVRHAVGLALRQKPRQSRGALVQEIWKFVSNALRLDEPCFPGQTSTTVSREAAAPKRKADGAAPKRKADGAAAKRGAPVPRKTRKVST